jgi:mRNA interferase MazF
LGVKRGDIVLVAPPGEFGKPRPALIIQSDRAYSTGYFTYLPITTDLLRVPDVRVPVLPTSENGLRLESEIMVDMVQTASLPRFRPRIGSVDPETLRRAQEALSLHLGFM